MNNATENKITYENNVSSEHEIKIDMTFGEALAITQQTYNYFAVKRCKDREEFFNKLNETIENHAKLNQENKQQTNSIEKLTSEYIKEDENKYIKEMNKEINNFTLYDVTYDKKSNFSGLTYIYDNGNTVNVAIACRGTAGLTEWKDWIQNFAMIFFPNTCSDKAAQKYATKILEKINTQNKQINIITLGHSKGGREAQKQMLALLNKNKDKDNNTVNICCLTFNSAPIVFYEWFYYKIKIIYKFTHTNLYLTDYLGFLKDWLKLFDFKYGKDTSYKINRTFDYAIYALAVIIGLITVFNIYPLIRESIGNPLMQIVLLLIAAVMLFFITVMIKLPTLLILLFIFFLHTAKHPYWIIFGISILSILVYLLNQYAHGIHLFKDEKSLYNELKDKNVSEIISTKDLNELVNTPNND